jgi:hypothetical protein
MAGSKYDEGSVVERVTALTSDWAEGAPEHFGDVEVGAVAVVYELNWPDGTSAIAYSSSDPRPWIQAAMFRTAMRQADRLSDGEDADDIANPS